MAKRSRSRLQPNARVTNDNSECMPVIRSQRTVAYICSSLMFGLTQNLFSFYEFTSSQIPCQFPIFHKCNATSSIDSSFLKNSIYTSTYEETECYVKYRNETKFGFGVS
jgi:hypothetical protein